jgi:hypothetical protein
MFRVGEVHYAATDPMFDGLHDAMAGLPYCAERMPRRRGPLPGTMGAFAWLLPLTFNTVWTPHGRWMRLHASLFPEHHRFAADVVASGSLAEIARANGAVLDAIEVVWTGLTSLPG